MILFFTFFVAIYGSVHVYAFLRTRSALGIGPGGGIALALFMLAMTLAPVLIRALERAGFEFTAWSRASDSARSSTAWPAVTVWTASC